MLSGKDHGFLTVTNITSNFIHKCVINGSRNWTESLRGEGHNAPEQRVARHSNIISIIIYNYKENEYINELIWQNSMEHPILMKCI